MPSSVAVALGCLFALAAAPAAANDEPDELMPGRIVVIREGRFAKFIAKPPTGMSFDLPDAKTREEFWHGLFELGVLTLRSGENSIRFRPALDITPEVIDEAMELMRKFCRQRHK